MTEPLRTCRVCGLECHNEEDLELFTKSKRGKHGRENECRKCSSIDSVKYQRENKDKYNAKQRRWRKANPEYNRLRYQEWRNKNREHVREHAREYYAKNKDRINELNRERYRLKKLRVGGEPR